MPPHPRRLLLALALALCGSACNTVEFYEKGSLSSAVMTLDQDPGLAASEQKIFYSTEGAAGGLGTSAGGGCGCY